MYNIKYNGKDNIVVHRFIQDNFNQGNVLNDSLNLKERQYNLILPYKPLLHNSKGVHAVKK